MGNESEITIDEDIDIVVDKSEWERNKAIADGMRAAARYMKAGRVTDFQNAMKEVMQTIDKEGQI